MMCPVCGSEEAVQLWSKPMSAIADLWRFQLGIDVHADIAGWECVILRQCKTCTLQYFLPAISGGPSLYSELQKHEWYYMGGKWEHLESLREVRDGDKVCEVGCGAGAFVGLVNEKGHGVALGIETNAAAVRFAQEAHIPVFNVTLSDFGIKHEAEFDLVCAFQVLEHIPQPASFLRDVARLVRPGGRITVSVPNRESFVAWEENLLDMPPHHVTRWSQTALTRLMKECGLKVERVVCEPLASYHVEWFVRILCRRYGKGVWGWLLHRWPVQRLLTRLLTCRRASRCVKGHTLLIVGVKG